MGVLLVVTGFTVVGHHTAQAARRLPVTAWISPHPIIFGGTLYGKTKPGATCTAIVEYSAGHGHVRTQGPAEHANREGVVWWSWHAMSQGAYGDAIVRCADGSRRGSARVQFTIG